MVDGPNSSIEFGSNAREALVRGGISKDLIVKNDADGKMIRTVIARPDGLVRETKEKKVVSREEIDERLETEDIKYFGDFSDEVSRCFFFIILYTLLCERGAYTQDFVSVVFLKW